MDNGQSLDAVDTAGLENAADLALTAFYWWRADIRRKCAKTTGATCTGSCSPAFARMTIPNDAHNFIGRICAQLSPPGTGRTLVDRINNSVPP
jgi:hypothetical protein